MRLSERWRSELEQLREQGRLRTLKPPTGIDFSSNDYLGYSKRVWPQARGVSEGEPSLTPRASKQECPDCGLPRSGTASRLLRGQHPIWDEVESKLADWHRAESTLMMTSGYAANEGLLSTVIAPHDVAFSDQFNHASIIDGLRLSKAERIVFPHNDVNQLESLMRRKAATRTARQAWFVVTESLFGMEGDTGPLPELADLAERYQAELIVDEAHATGCFGQFGSGIVDALNLRDRVLATVHTGGKALAVPGAYIAGSRLLKDLLVNRCRQLIFTTALPPQIGAWWLDALELVSTDDAARGALRERYDYIRKECDLRGVAVGGSHYIATVVLGADAVAMQAARHLQQAGFDVRAIRPPTVAEGTARLRISVHADHEAEVLRRLADVLGSVTRA